MDLLDRYLANVGFLLPAKDRADILSELRDILMSKMEEREDALGRPLGPVEQEAVLKAFGHPLSVAGRYRSDRQLIGPTLYPFWLFVMQVGTVIVTINAVVLGVVRAVEARTPEMVIAGAFSHIVPMFLTLLGGATLAFAIIERTGASDRVIEAWQPSRLPAIKLKRQTRANQIAEIIIGIAVLVLWARPSAIPLIYTGGHGESVHVGFSAILAAVYWPIMAYLAARILSNVADLFQFGPETIRRAVSIVTCLGGLAICVYAATAGPWIDVQTPGGPAFPEGLLEAGPWVHITGPDSLETARINFIANLSIGWSFVGAAIGMGVQICIDAWRLFRAMRSR